MTFLSLSRDYIARPAGRRPSLKQLFALAAQRRRLSQLDAAALDDMGISAAEARRESRRPLWDVPDHWTA